MEITRFGKIKGKDLSDWRVWHDAAKNRYEDELSYFGFWQTFDSKLIAFTFKLPLFVGAPLRVIFSIIFCSNRYEPYPIGNNNYVNNLWKNKHPFIRWFLWHKRNPFCDLRKFYLGFGYAAKVIHSPKKWGYVRWVKFSWIPFWIPFVDIKTKYIDFGWQKRGILSAKLKLRSK